MFVPKFIDIKPDTPRANSLETPIKGWSQNLLLRPIIVLMMFRNPARRKRLGKLIKLVMSIVANNDAFFLFPPILPVSFLAEAFPLKSS